MPSSVVPRKGELMDLKTYQAYSMGEVLAQIRSDLGEDAVILHTRTFKRGGFLGFGRKTIHEVTASTPAHNTIRDGTQATESAPTSGLRTPARRTTAQSRMSRSPRPTLIPPLSPSTPVRKRQSGADAARATSKIQSGSILTDLDDGKSVAAGPAQPTAKGKRYNLVTLLNANKRRPTAGESSPGDVPSNAPEKTGRVGLSPPSSVSPPAKECQSASPDPMVTVALASAPTLKSATATPIPAEPPPPGSGLTVKPAKARGSAPPTSGDRPLHRVARRFVVEAATSLAKRPLLVLPKALANQTLPPTVSRQHTSTPHQAHAQPQRANREQSAAPALAASTDRGDTVGMDSGTASPAIIVAEPPSRSSQHWSGSQRPVQPPTVPIEPPIGDPQLRRELEALRGMVGKVLQQQIASSQPTMPEPLFQQYLAMIENEVARELANDICGKARDELTRDQLRNTEITRSAVLRHLASLVPVAGDSMDAAVMTADGRPLTIALVGPTGVGKTTTVAKLAATFKLRQGRRVGLITTDTYRIAAVDQLRTYANIIGLPLKVALTPTEMAAACHELRQCSDIILIDTAGRSPNDSARLEEIRLFVEAAAPHEVHLVLSSTASESVLMRTISRYSTVKTDRIIFTKLDEAVTFGVLVNVLRKTGKRLSFVTNGQEVPDHIEIGRAEDVARLILGTRVDQ